MTYYIPMNMASPWMNKYLPYKTKLIYGTIWMDNQSYQVENKSYQVENPLYQDSQEGNQYQVNPETQKIHES